METHPSLLNQIFQCNQEVSRSSACFSVHVWSRAVVCWHYFTGCQRFSKLSGVSFECRSWQSPSPTFAGVRSSLHGDQRPIGPQRRAGVYRRGQVSVYFHLNSSLLYVTCEWANHYSDSFVSESWSTAPWRTPVTRSSSRSTSTRR